MKFCCMNIQCVKEECARQSRVYELYPRPIFDGHEYCHFNRSKDLTTAVSNKVDKFTS